MASSKDLSGKQFGRLTVIEQHGRNRHGSILWMCQCDCGRLTVADTHSLISGHKRSCGCLVRERVGNMNRTHGKSDKRLYHLYFQVVDRCTNPNNPAYEYYGGRGIKVCDEWSSWERFYEWAISNGYEANLTLDRIDVNGSYEPSNCRWATRKQQMRNTRKTRYLTFAKERKPLIEWCEQFGLSFNTVATRFARGWEDPYEILFGRKRGITNG